MGGRAIRRESNQGSFLEEEAPEPLGRMGWCSEGRLA